MLNFELKALSYLKRFVVVAGVSAALAGCALDELAKEDTFEPYGGSKQHPIKVVNGHATVDKCGDWSENVTETSDNTMANNHGCAVQSNIAAMAAYPNDLVRLRQMPRPPAFTRIPAITGLGGGAAGGAAGSAATP